MNDLQILERLSKADEYAPDLPLPAQVWDQEATRVEIDRRIGSAAPPARKVAAIRSGRDGWLIAAAAFVAVLLVGVALTLFSGNREDVVPAVTETTQAPPTTQASPPTTQASPPTTSAPPVATTVIEQHAVQPIVDRFVTAYNSHDSEALLALLDPAVTYESGIGRGGYRRTPHRTGVLVRSGCDIRHHQMSTKSERRWQYQSCLQCSIQ
jgi:hypothetical protein